MSAETVTEYGRIIIPEEVIAMIAGYAATENYGIVGMKLKKLSVKKGDFSRGVLVTRVDSDTVGIDLYVEIEYGVSLAVVAQNVKDNVKYRIEKYTNLKVSYVNIHVEGVRAQQDDE